MEQRVPKFSRLRASEGLRFQDLEGLRVWGIRAWGLGFQGLRFVG